MQKTCDLKLTVIGGYLRWDTKELAEATALIAKIAVNLFESFVYQTLDLCP